MNGINLVMAALFTIISVLSVSLLAQHHRWKGLLIISLGFYYLLVGPKIVVILLMAWVIFRSGHLIHRQKIKIWIPIIVLLLPLVLYKSTRFDSHFENYLITNLQGISSGSWSSTCSKRSESAVSGRMGIRAYHNCPRKA